jgi:hypothetical protein
MGEHFNSEIGELPPYLEYLYMGAFFNKPIRNWPISLKKVKANFIYEDFIPPALLVFYY